MSSGSVVSVFGVKGTEDQNEQEVRWPMSQQCVVQCQGPVVQNRNESRDTSGLSIMVAT